MIASVPSSGVLKQLVQHIERALGQRFVKPPGSGIYRQHMDDVQLRLCPSLRVRAAPRNGRTPQRRQRKEARSDVSNYLPPLCVALCAAPHNLRVSLHVL